MLLGQSIRMLVQGAQGPGSYTAVWNGRDEQGRGVGNGLYFYRLASGEFAQTKRMLLVK
jgi:hypothetical protein